jgi:hypothetical protein
VPWPDAEPRIPVAQFSLNVLAAVRVGLVDLVKDLADVLGLGRFNH